MTTQSSSPLPHDCFGRTTANWACPECGARFISKGMCRGVGDGPDKRAHDHEVPTHRLYGCTPPPTRRFLVSLPVAIMASTDAQAQEMARAMVEEEFPKRFVEVHGYRLRAYPVETIPEANFKRRMEFAYKNGYHPYERDGDDA